MKRLGLTIAITAAAVVLVLPAVLLWPFLVLGWTVWDVLKENGH